MTGDQDERAPGRVAQIYKDWKERRNAIPAQYRLSLIGHTETILVWVLIVGKTIKWAVSALYFLILQVKYVIYPRWPFIHMYWGASVYQEHPGARTIWFLKGYWDHAPWWLGWAFGHIHVGVMRAVSQWLEQLWVNAAWVAPRHDVRDTLIGLYAGLAIQVLVANSLAWKDREPGFLTDKLRIATRRQRRRTSLSQYTATPFLSPIFGSPGFALGIWLGAIVPGLVAMGLHGNSQLDLQLEDYVGAAKWQHFLIGVLASLFFARIIAMKPGADFSLHFIERAVTRRRPANWRLGTPVAHKPLWGWPPALRNRFNYIMDRGIAVAQHGRAASVFMSFVLLAYIALSGYGAWLTSVGPAAGVG